MKPHKLPFLNDYMYACHPHILKQMAALADTPHTGYGCDELCEAAREKIRQACCCPEAGVHFLIGGTATNVTAIDALIRSYQGVLAAQSGHINTFEAGAMESAGHKILPLRPIEGKVMPHILSEWLERDKNDENRDHTVRPGALYISQPTEVGTLYSLEELTALSHICHQAGIRLFVDGARLGYALASPQCNIDLPDLARLSDGFYIGGTKLGALMGEALVFPRPQDVPDFFTQMKRHNNLLAKGWLLGMQFDVFFTDDLYHQIGRHALDMAQRLRRGIEDMGIPFYTDSPTNLQFIILHRDEYHQLRQEADCEIWEELDNDRVAIRLVTSWQTTPDDVDSLIQVLRDIHQA